MSLPLPPISVLAAGAAVQRVVAGAAVEGDRLVGERAVALVDPDLVVAAARLHDDRGERRAVEREVDGAVVGHVDLQRAAPARARSASLSLAPSPTMFSVSLSTLAE